MNSVKYILQKRNMLQNDLIPEGEVKQYVSRWILRQRKIPKHVIVLWVNLLGVPSNYFVDNKGYCKELNESEIYELDEFLLDHPMISTCEELKESPQYMRIERESALKKYIIKIKKEIHNDILSIKELSNTESLEEVLDTQENNLYFYEKILRLHKSNAIELDEWNAILKALAYLKDNIPYNEIPEGCSREIYDVIVKHREEVKKKQKEEIETYKNIFGDII